MENTLTSTTDTQGVEVVESIFKDYFNEVVSAYPSIFSKDDVIMLLNRVQNTIVEKGLPVSNKSVNLEKLREDVLEAIENHDYNDNYDLEAEMNRKHSIEVSVSFDTTYLRDEIHDIFNNCED